MQRIEINVRFEKILDFKEVRITHTIFNHFSNVSATLLTWRYWTNLKLEHNFQQFPSCSWTNPKFCANWNPIKSKTNLFNNYLVILAKMIWLDVVFVMIGGKGKRKSKMNHNKQHALNRYTHRLYQM